MENYRGSLKGRNGGRLSDVTVRVTEGPDGEGGTQWFGSFEVPPGEQVSEGGRYQLVLEDGRSGEIVIENAESRDATVSVGFVGVGRLS